MGVDSDPNILHGKPRIVCTRIPVSTVIRDVAEGYTLEEIAADYPPLTVEQVKEVLLLIALVLDNQMLIRDEIGSMFVLPGDKAKDYVSTKRCT